MTAPLRARAALGAAAALLAADGRAAEPTLEERVDALVKSLGEPDGNVRARAAKDARKLGPEAVPLLLARIPPDVGSKRWEGVLDAIGALGADDAIAEIQATRTEWTAKGWRRAAGKPARRGRGRRGGEDEAPVGERVVDAILDRLRTHRDPSVRTVVPLEPGTLWDASFVPPWIERPVGRKLPDEVAGADVPAREDGERLALDLARDGKFATFVPAAAPRVVDTGTKRAPRPVVVQRTLGRWTCAPAAILTGDLDGVAVVLLDADQDGAFDGDDDLIRFGDGVFRRIGADEDVAWVEPEAGDGRIVRWRIEAEGGAVALHAEREPEPSWRTPEQAKALAALNRGRAMIGLAPQRLDRVRSAACREHHDYWTANGFSGHDQEPGRPGATKTGATAGQASSVGTCGDGGRFVRDILWTVLHRKSCLGDARVGVGAWSGASGSLTWGSRIDAGPRGAPLLVPGPGATSVPVACEPEIPVPDKDPQWYATPRGAPVAVTWSGLGAAWADLADVRLELFRDGAGDPLPGTLWWRGHRYHEGHGAGFADESAIFCSDGALSPGTTYVARFRATGRDGAVEFAWRFTTE